MSSNIINSGNCPRCRCCKRPLINNSVDNLKAHAEEMELSQINFLDSCRNYCEDDLTKCKTVQYCFIDGALFEVTFEESEQLDDFAFKLREADNHG